MTALLRAAPVRAPRVSSNAVRISPAMPRRPRVQRIRWGSSFHRTRGDNQAPTAEPDRRTQMRYRSPRRARGSTYRSAMPRGYRRGLAERLDLRLGALELARGLLQLGRRL